MALKSGIDFSCSGTTCRAKNSSTGENYRELQRQLNRYAGALGFSRLTVDGIIGNLTLSAVGRVAKYAKDNAKGVLGFVAKNTANMVLSNLRVDYIAQFPVAIANMARSTADAQGLKEGGFTSKPSFPTVVKPSPITTPVDQGIISIPELETEKASQWDDWLLYGVGGLFLVGALYYFIISRK